MVDHPENFETSDADYVNKPRPQPRTFDELADAPDPLAVAEANRASTRQALTYMVVVVVSSLIVGIGTRFPLGMTLTWALVAMVLPLLGMIGAGIGLLRKLNKYLRWRTWMGVFWFLVMHFMAWGTTVLPPVLMNSPELLN